MIEDTIGMGGMGAVYRAVDQKFGSLVAIKETFYGDAAELSEAFEREARLLNGLHHPIFPHVSDCFTENGGHFLVMEYIEGEDLSETLKRGAIFPIETVVGWAHDLLDGLDYLHSQDPPVIHRDIKPNNLKLTSRGRIVLLDFGMAKETSSNTYAAKSVFGYSRRYSPLEQIEGSGTDTRSDIFSLGATLYHLLTGKPPVDVLARASAIVAGRPDRLVPASIINPHVPASIAAALSKALALNAENRFRSAREMSEALEGNAPSTDVVAESEPVPIFVADTPPVVEAPAGAAQSRTAVLNEDDLGQPVPVIVPDATPVVESPAVAPQGRMVAFNEDDVDLATNEIPKGTPGFSAGGEFGRRVRGALPASVSAMRIRRPARRGYAVALTVCLLAFALAFATYRVTRSGQDEANITQQAEPSESNPIPTEEEVAADVGNTEPEINAEVETLSAPDEEVPVARDPLELRNGPIASRRKPSAETAKEDARTAKQVAKPTRPADDRSRNTTAPARRPRRVPTPVFEQPRISSIEAIMTGVPYDQRPRRVDEDDALLQEERRRRRLRRIRQAQRNGYPF